MRFPHHQIIRDELARMRRQVAELRPGSFRLRNLVLFLIAVAAGVFTIVALGDTTMTREAVYMAGIFVLAALLWVTEALPLFATALLVIALEIILLANPGGWANLGFAAGDSPSYREFLNSIADPVIILFFGGFLLAHAATKEGVDRAMAASAAADGPLVAQVGISIALAASASMALPISTPPNALAYAHGEFRTNDIALVGSIVGILTAGLILAFGGPIIRFWIG